MARMTKLQVARSEAARKAWATRRATAKRQTLATTMRPRSSRTPVPTPSRPVAVTARDLGENILKGLRRRSASVKAIVGKIENANSMEYYAGEDRNVLVLYTK